MNEPDFGKKHVVKHVITFFILQTCRGGLVHQSGVLFNA